MTEEPGLERQPAPGRQPARRGLARRQAMLVGLAAAAAIAVVAMVMIWSGGGGGSGGVADGAAAAASTPRGVRSHDVKPWRHVSGSVDYAQAPPVGGDHNPVWQNCGFYSEAIVAEHGVHSLEHGAVWITYRRALAADELEDLRRLASSQTHILISPWDGELVSPVVASAWGRQLGVDSATSPALDDFVRAFRSGPQTPEPGAPCTGGRSTPR